MHEMCKSFSLHLDIRSAKETLGKDQCMVEVRTEDGFTFSQRVDQTTEFYHPPGICQMVAISSNSVTGIQQ